MKTIEVQIATSRFGGIPAGVHRVENARAAELVNVGVARFVPKSLWKDTVRDKDKHIAKAVETLKPQRSTKQAKA